MIIKLLKKGRIDIESFIGLTNHMYDDTKGIIKRKIVVEKVKNVIGIETLTLYCLSFPLFFIVIDFLTQNYYIL